MFRARALPRTPAGRIGDEEGNCRGRKGPAAAGDVVKLAFFAMLLLQCSAPLMAEASLFLSFISIIFSFVGLILLLSLIMVWIVLSYLGKLSLLNCFCSCCLGC